MFAQLMNDVEKKNFLELIYHIANIDGEYAEEEEELINNYKIELGLDTIPSGHNTEELVQYFGEKSKELKKVVYFELYGMMMADGKIEDKESELLNKINDSFALENNEYESIVDAAKTLQEAYDKVYDALFE